MENKPSRASGETATKKSPNTRSKRATPPNNYEHHAVKDGVIHIGGVVTRQSMADAINQLTWLDQNFVPTKDHDMITVVLNSPGGLVIDGLALYDTIMHMKHPVRTIVKGMAASMGSFLLMAGAPEERYAHANSSIMIHELSGGTAGKATEMDMRNHVSQKLNDRLLKLYNFHTSIPLDTLRGLMREDVFMNPEEAKAMNLLDPVIYESLDQTSDFKKAWQMAMKKINMDEARARGRARIPANDDSMVKIGNTFKKPTFKTP